MPLQYVGYSGTGSVAQSGGTNNLGTCLYLGYNAGSSGAYTLSGNSLLFANNYTGCEYIGYSGTGTFTQSGGTHSQNTNGVKALDLGCNPGGSGTYNLSGSGLLSVPNECVGCDPDATALFSQTGGTNAVSLLSIGSGGQYVLGGGTCKSPAVLPTWGSSPATASRQRCPPSASWT